MSETAVTIVPDIAVVERDGEPRARDVDIADRLGFSRARDIRPLIERNRSELEGFGPLTRCDAAPIKSGKGRVMPVSEFWLNEEQALLLATLSSAPNAPAVRAMLIRTFVAWRRGHLTTPAEIDMDAVGGMVKRIVAKQLREIVPALVEAEVGAQQYGVIRGMTAGRVVDAAGVGSKKGLRGLARRVSDRLRRFHAQKGVPVKIAELGCSTAYVFDPATCQEWLQSGGRAEIERLVAERKGQGLLRLVQSKPPA